MRSNRRAGERASSIPTIEAWRSTPVITITIFAADLLAEDERMRARSYFPGSGSSRRRAIRAVCSWSFVETGWRPVVVGGDVAVWFGELDDRTTDGQLGLLATPSWSGSRTCASRGGPATCVVTRVSAARTPRRRVGRWRRHQA